MENPKAAGDNSASTSFTAATVRAGPGRQRTKLPRRANLFHLPTDEEVEPAANRIVPRSGAHESAAIAQG
jgi:hypothetical protein